jgi:hypothetical protein
MSGQLDLEQRYRRVLRLLPGYYRDRWEEDMVAAFLDSWLTGDPETDEYIMRVARPSLMELASVAGLAARLYLGGAGAPRRYFAWGQAVRGAVLAAVLGNALWGLGQFLTLFRTQHVIGGFLAPPGGFWPEEPYLVGGAWVVVFLALLAGDHRVARVVGALVAAASLTAVVHAQLNGPLPWPFTSYANWALVNLAPVLAMAAFHRDAPPPARRPWLLALPAFYLLLSVPVLAVEFTGHGDWVPDNPGLCCLLVALLGLVHAPRAWSRRPGTSVWSLTLVLLAALAGLNRIATLPFPPEDPRVISVCLIELLILAAATVLVVPDATRAQTALPSPPASRSLG